VGNVAEASVEVRNQGGLHVHPADLIAKTALHYLSKITITRGADIANARSIVALTALGAGLGSRLTIRAEGPDADPAVRAIVALFERKFGEE